MRKLILVLLLVLPWIACRGAPPGRETDAASTPAPPPREGLATGEVLEMRFLDVGQGDAVLLRSGGKTALVDSGSSDRIVERLRELGVDTLDLVVASHNHADHIGGMDAVLESMPVRFYLDNGYPASTKIQGRVLELLERHPVTYLQATPRTISLGAARLRIIPPPAEVAGDEQNNRSVSVLVESDGFRGLLTGDSETELLDALVETGAIPDVDVLKAAHHGSRNGVTPALLARARPEVVAISLGASNNYGHPHPEALQLYCTPERRVLRTDLHGDITVRVDATGSYVVDPERSVPRSSACTPTPP